MFSLKMFTLMCKPLAIVLTGSVFLACSGPNNATVNKYSPYDTASPIEDIQPPAGRNARNATPTGSPAAPSGNASVNAVGEVALYETTVYPILKARCGACHSSTAAVVQSPEFADEDPSTAWEHAISKETGVKIDFINLTASRFYQRPFTDRHNCGDQASCEALAAEILPMLEDLKAGLQAQQIPLPGVDFGNAAQQTTRLTFAQSFEKEREDFEWETLVIEAESAMFTGVMKAIEDGGAKGGFYIGVEDGESDDDNYNRDPNDECAIYDINIPVAGTYRVVGLIKAENNNSDSFQLIVDNGEINRWRVDDDDDPLWHLGTDDDEVQDFDLTAGDHEFKICQGEDGTLLDQLAITRIMVQQDDLENYDPGIAVDLGPVQVLSYDVSTIAKTPGITLEVEIAEFSDGAAYKIKNLRIIKPLGSPEVSVQNVSVLCNGVVLSDVASYSRIDMTTTGESTLLSSTAEILVKDSGTGDCELSFEFGSIGPASAVPAAVPPVQ